LGEEVGLKRCNLRVRTRITLSQEFDDAMDDDFGEIGQERLIPAK
jgi:hypothetical protein